MVDWMISLALVAPALRRISTISLSPASLGKIRTMSRAVRPLWLMAFTSNERELTVPLPSSISNTCKDNLSHFCIFFSFICQDSSQITAVAKLDDYLQGPCTSKLGQLALWPSPIFARLRFESR